MYQALHTRRGTVHEAASAALSLSRDANVPLFRTVSEPETFPQSFLLSTSRSPDMFVAVLATLVLFATPASSAAPHIIYILTDDLGSNYPGCTYPLAGQVQRDRSALDSPQRSFGSLILSPILAGERRGVALPLTQPLPRPTLPQTITARSWSKRPPSIR